MRDSDSDDPVKPFTFLKEGYKKSTRVRVDGLAATGQRSPQGIVKHRDHWDGSMDALVIPQPVTVSAGSTELNGRRPKERYVRFRMTIINDDQYVHLRDLEAALCEAGAHDIARRIVVACGQRPAQ
jgi:hypothetical protein